MPPIVAPPIVITPTPFNTSAKNLRPRTLAMNVKPAAPNIVFINAAASSFDVLKPYIAPIIATITVFARTNVQTLIPNGTTPIPALIATAAHTTASTFSSIPFFSAAAVCSFSLIKSSLDIRISPDFDAINLMRQKICCHQHIHDSENLGALTQENLGCHHIVLIRNLDHIDI